jgi:hypothetical protein
MKSFVATLPCAAALRVAGPMSFPEFQVHYDTASAVSLKGDESAKFAASFDQIVADQDKIISSLESKKSMLLQSEPMGESQVTINAFEAPHAALLSPESLSAPFESYDFYVEQGSGALPGLADIEAQTNKMSHASLVESEPMGESQVTINAFEAPHAALLQSEPMGESQVTINAFEAPHAALLESPRVTQSPMVWLNIRGAAHASLVESEPMGESQVTINAFEAPHAALLSPESLSAPFESYDFYVEQGSGALPSLADIEAQTNKMSHASLVETMPAMNLHVAQSGAAAVQLSESQQKQILSQRERIISTLKARRTRMDKIHELIASE